MKLKNPLTLSMSSRLTQFGKLLRNVSSRIFMELPTSVSSSVCKQYNNSNSDTVGWATGRASGRQKVGCRFDDGDNLTGALHVLQFQLSSLTTSIALSSNKIHNGDILVSANPGPPGKWPLKRRENNSNKCNRNNDNDDDND